MWEKPLGGCFRSLDNFSNCCCFYWGYFLFTLLQACNCPQNQSRFNSAAFRLSVLQLDMAKRKVCSQPLDILGRWYWSPRSTLGASIIWSQAHVEQRDVRQLNVSSLLFLWSDFTDSSAGEPGGRVRFFSLWSVGVFSTHKLKSISPILSDLQRQIWSQGSFPGWGGEDLVPAQRAARHRRPPASQSFLYMLKCESVLCKAMGREQRVKT